MEESWRFSNTSYEEHNEERERKKEEVIKSDARREEMRALLRSYNAHY